MCACVCVYDECLCVYVWIKLPVNLGSLGPCSARQLKALKANRVWAADGA